MANPVPDPLPAKPRANRASSRPLPGKALLVAVFGLLVLAAAPVLAQSVPALTSSPGPGGSTNYSLSIQTLLFLTSLTFIPAALLMMTAFTRIVIVLSMLRQAMGLQMAPPNQVVIGLSLFLTFFVMAPTFEKVYQDAYQPLSENKITFPQAMERASVPMKQFMLRQTREADIALFAGFAKVERIESPEAVPMRILVPAYVTSELKTAFQIGFIIFIPFLVIDMVVGATLMSMGMMMMSPVMVALPFKMMLFVLADGWHLVLGSLVKSFAP